jgi:hypothetical protein
MIRSVFDGKNDLAKLATGGAWLFAIGSLFPLVWLMSDGGANGAVFKTSAGGNEYTIPLLTYSGGIGMLLIWGEILAVAGAFILTAAPRVPRKLARIGHGVLIAWSVLWMLGTWRLATVHPGFWTFQGVFLTALCGCTVWRAWCNWSPGASATGASARADDSSAPEPNFFNDQHQPQAGPLPSNVSTRKQIAEALEHARIAAVAASQKIVVGVKAGISAARDHRAKT